MITGELKNKVNKIWEIFWTGGITNPLSVIEQFTYLLFIKGLDDKQLAEEKLAKDKVFDFLKRENIIQTNLTDCSLGRLGYKPAEKYKKALKNTDKKMLQLKVNGVEFITERRVFDNGANGLEKVNCPYCKTNNIENNWAEILGNWYEKQGSYKLQCFTCKRESDIFDFIFYPTWGFGYFGIVFWNWGVLSQEFISDLENITSTKIKLIEGRL